jgi:TRAP-type C4-dicarboxylate transport system permease small subunit
MESRKLDTFYSNIKKVNTFCASLAGLILLFVTLSIFVDVILRYFFDRPSIWVTEVSTYLFLYIIFLGTAYTLQQGGHIRVTFLLNPLPPRIRRVVNFITTLFGTVFTAVLLWQACVMTWTAFREHWTSPTMLNAPYAYIHVAIVIGSFLLLMTFLCGLIIQLRTDHSSGVEAEA